MKLASTIIAVLSIVVMLTLPTPASAYDATRGFLCEKVWSGPSASNNIASCMLNQTHLINDYLLTAPRLAPAIVGILCILASVLNIVLYPIFIIFRYCCNCCGGRSRRPDGCCCGSSDWDDKTDDEINAAYGKGAAVFTKACAFVVAGCCAAAVVITLIGSGLAISTYNQVFLDAHSVLDWAGSKKTAIQKTMRLQDGSYIPPLTNDTFTSMQSQLDGYSVQLDSLRNQFVGYVQYANTGALCIAIVPMACIVITVLCALFNIRSVILFLNSILHFIFIIPYGLLGGLILVLSVPFTDVSAERDKLLAGAPGLFTWWLVPMFDSQAPFTSIQNSVNDAQSQQSIAACTTLRGIATNANVYSNATVVQAQQVYNWNVTNPTTQCASLYALNNNLNSMRLLSNPVSRCRNISDALQPTQCTIFVCAETCTDLQVKSTSVSVVTSVGEATAAYNSYQILSPLLSFLVIFQTMMGFVTTIAVLASALTLSGVGLCLFCIFFVVDYFVIFRGQKRFFSLGDVKEMQPQETQREHPPAKMV